MKCGAGTFYKSAKPSKCGTCEKAYAAVSAAVVASAKPKKKKVFAMPKKRAEAVVESVDEEPLFEDEEYDEGEGYEEEGSADLDDVDFDALNFDASIDTGGGSGRVGSFEEAVGEQAPHKANSKKFTREQVDKKVASLRGHAKNNRDIIDVGA
jgi:hypothetical protein